MCPVDPPDEPKFLIIIFWLLLLVSCGYALWRGRKYERTLQ